MAPTVVAGVVPVAVVIVNWRGADDTIECLESVFRLDPAPVHVIVCDNGSGDESIGRIRAWAAGETEPPAPANPALRGLTSPPVAKPIEVVPEAGGAAVPAPEGSVRPRLVLLETGRNLGFAGGNNVGIAEALSDPEIEAVWLLNNDTVVEPVALGRLLDVLRATPAAGMCGSTLLYYDDPRALQALGGATYNRWTGLSRHIGIGRPAGTRLPEEERRMAYVVGASMLVGRDFIEDVGMMDEGLFLYFEELDWIRRGRGRYTLAFAPGSRVFHKEGRSTGARAEGAKSDLSEFYFHRNRLRVARRYHPATAWCVRGAILGAAVKRAARREWARARRMLRVALT